MSDVEIIKELESEIKNFRLIQSNENLVTLLNVLLKSRLVAPCQMRVEEGYEDSVNKLKKGDSILDLEGVHFVAEVLTASNGTKWIGYYTTGFQMPKNYLSQYSKMDYKFEEICNQELLDNTNIDGIVINPFTESFYLDKTLLKLLLNAIENEEEKS